jgi:hypothetical protein
MRDEKGDLTADIEIKRMIRSTLNNHLKKLKNLEEMNKFLEPTTYQI